MALREAGFTSRVDHRSFKDQGLDLEPTPRLPLPLPLPLPQKICYAERRTGKPTPEGDQIRAMHRERVEARLKGADELARVVQMQKEQKRQRQQMVEYERRMALMPKKKALSALTGDERNELRRKKYPAIREKYNQGRREAYKTNRAKVLEQGRAWRRLTLKWLGRVTASGVVRPRRRRTGCGRWRQVC